MSWYWRTKPRSIIKTIQWFPYFGKLQGQNWTEASTSVSAFNQKKIYPVRRSYIYHAHGEEDNWLSTISYEDYLSGSYDRKETESNGRNDKSTYEFLGFGYVSKKGIIHVTECGHQIIQNQFDQEQYLKQLLKLHLPNPIQKIKSPCKHPDIFPMQLVLSAFTKFESLNRSELALLFGCDEPAQIPRMLAAIEDFKNQYALLTNKLDTKKIKQLFSSIYETYYGKLQNKVDSFYDYAEALSRSLVYTGLFRLSGRSLATKVRIATHAKKKVELLQRTFSFSYPEDISNIDTYMQWYGSSNNIMLPWDNATERQELIQEKLSVLQELLSKKETPSPIKDYEQTTFGSQADLNLLLAQTQKTDNISALKDMEKTIDKAITNHNEDYFIRVASKTEKERQFILEKFDDILANDDMSALWLEVNTWKSLIAVQGNHHMKRNFNIEEDLSPRSFAPGVGNTPDMELYLDNTILLPEVSLMTGVRQWEHEASSVIDHVLHFMERTPDKQVLGLFISSRIHLRTMWQFFLLNRESWLGKKIPVVPLTIPQYVAVIQHCYQQELPITELLSFLESLSLSAEKLADYHLWEQKIAKAVNTFTS